MVVRRLLPLTAALMMLCPSALAAAEAEEGFTFAQVQEAAEAVAAAGYQAPRRASDAFLALNYDTYRLIAPRNDTALWRDTDSPFWAEFFPAGFFFDCPVRIHIVDESGQVMTLEAGEQWFQFRGATAELAHDPGGGFSGLRLLGDEAGESHKTEFAVFQGASYFRARGEHQIYGASARGLAIDIGLAKPEEFPRFTEFWLKRPPRGAKQAVVWALLDSPGVTGAYQFTISTGKDAAIDVEAHLWFRHGIQKLGIAPLTSMWMWEADGQPDGDPRPEVHDSDGLLIHHGANEWLWRPLRRPAAPGVSSWPVDKLLGFGLLQRDRDEAHYRDAEALYHRRPSMWIEPAGSWGPGRVELLELPSDQEGNDNIAAFWVSDEAVAGPSERVLTYRVTFGDGPQRPKSLMTVIDSHVRPIEQGAVVEVEFATDGESGDPTELVPRAWCDVGEIRDVELVAESNRRRMVRFHFDPPPTGVAQLHVQLISPGSPISEEWSFLWTPP